MWCTLVTCEHAMTEMEKAKEVYMTSFTSPSDIHNVEWGGSSGLSCIT